MTLNNKIRFIKSNETILLQDFIKTNYITSHILSSNKKVLNFYFYFSHVVSYTTVSGRSLFLFHLLSYIHENPCTDYHLRMLQLHHPLLHLFFYSSFSEVSFHVMSILSKLTKKSFVRAPGFFVKTPYLELS